MTPSIEKATSKEWSSIPSVADLRPGGPRTPLTIALDKMSMNDVIKLLCPHTGRMRGGYAPNRRCNVSTRATTGSKRYGHGGRFVTRHHNGWLFIKKVSLDDN